MAMPGMVKNLLYAVIFFSLLPLIPVITGGIAKLARRFDSRVAVGVLPIKGLLTDSTLYMRHLHAFFKDNQIKAIVLKIESQGSTAGTGQAIFSEILNLKKEYPKPIIVLVENICTSGAYYIASAADHIIATPAAIIGSIGVAFSSLFQIKDFMEQFKIHYVPLSAGDQKNAGNPFVNQSPENIAMLQELLNDSYEQFTADVARQRKIALDTADQWANGKIFSARKAKELGLVDELGTVSQAVQAVKNKAFIETDIRWVHAPKPSAWERFTGKEDDEGSGNMLTRAVNTICSAIESRYNAQQIRF